MKLLWLSALCALVMVLILVSGERTLPLFDGDRDLAGRVTMAALMVLSGGILAGLVPVGMRVLARLLRGRMDHAGEAAAGHWMVRLDLPGLFEAAAPWAALGMGLGGVGLAVAIWHAF